MPSARAFPVAALLAASAAVLAPAAPASTTTLQSTAAMRPTTSASAVPPPSPAPAMASVPASIPDDGRRASATVAAAADPRPRLAASAVLAAASAVRADPDFGGSRTEWEWRLKRQASDGTSTPPSIPDWVRWLAGWLAEGGRVLAWIAAAIAIALLVVGARHWLRLRGDALATSRRRLPTHVGTLDIRPESLPDDLAGAAGGLWQRGDRRGALALLYRGALSRLVHAHGVAIESSSTEAEVVVLARKRLAAARGDFVARLVATWTLASWGGRLADEATFEALRTDFDRALPRAADALPPAGPGVDARAVGGGTALA